MHTNCSEKKERRNKEFETKIKKEKKDTDYGLRYDLLNWMNGVWILNITYLF